MDNKAKYRAFCHQREDLPIFFYDWYLDGVCEGGLWDAVILEKGNEVQAVLPYFLKQKWGFKYIAMPHFTKHLGPYLVNKNGKAQVLLQNIIEKLPKVDCFKQNFHPLVTDWLPFYWQDYQQTTRYTYVIDLNQPLGQIFKQVNRNMRRNIRKAETLLSVTDHFDLATFYQFNQKSFRRQNLSTPYSFELLQQHDEALANKQKRKMFFGVDQANNIHSVAKLIWDKNSAYYHISGDDPEFRKSGSGIYLIWKAIEFAKNELGVASFDFEGSMMPTVEAIRRQFGATQIPFFSIWKYHSRLYHWIDQLKS